MWNNKQKCALNKITMSVELSGFFCLLMLMASKHHQTKKQNRYRRILNPQCRLMPKAFVFIFQTMLVTYIKMSTDNPLSVFPKFMMPSMKMLRLALWLAFRNDFQPKINSFMMSCKIEVELC